jgi:RHS repeat-associated protein
LPSVSVETSDFPAATAGATGTKQTVSATAGVSATASIALKPSAVLTAGPVPVHQVSGSVANGAAGAATVVVPKPAGVSVGAVLIASVAASDVTAAGGGTTVYSEGFESGSVGSWSPWISPATISVTTAQARTGTKSLQMNPTATQSSCQVYPAFTAGVVNTMSGWVKGTAGGVISPTFTSFNAAWAQLNQTYGTNVTLTGGWQQWTATYTPPAGTANFAIAFQKLDTTVWWLDDFSISTGGGGGTTATTVTAPSGWAAVTSNSTAGVQLTTWSHVAAAADPASWTFNLSQTARAAATVSAYTGVDTVLAVDATAIGTNIAGTSHTAPSVNTGGANRLAITVTAPTAVTAMTPPSGSTERADQAGGTTVPSVSVETADFGQAVAGATGTKQTVTAAAATSVTATIALRPVSTTGGTGANTTTSITKFYRSGGATVALRRDGTITWLLGDIQGGIAVSVPNGPGLTGVQWQRYLPYGQRRGSNLAASGTNSNDQITTTDHGFLGQVEDNTGLDYLNNRYHDPALGRFVSVDPLVAVTLDAYGYGNNNPTTKSDPRGLCVRSSAGHGSDDGRGACATNNGSGDAKDRGLGSNGLPSPPSASTTSSGATKVSPANATQIQSAGQTLLAQGIANEKTLATGGCVDLSVSMMGVLGFDGSGCMVATGKNWGIIGTFGAGLQSNNSLTAGLIFSNAQALGDLDGSAVCGGLSGNVGVFTGGATVCAGTRSDGSLNGIYTVFAYTGLTVPGAPVGGEYMGTYTWTRSFGKTTGFVQWILPRWDGADPGINPNSDRNPDGSFKSGGVSSSMDGAGGTVSKWG